MIRSSPAQSEMHKSRQDSYEATRSRRVLLVDESTGLIREELVEYRSCPACDSNETKNLFVKNGGTYHRCIQCGTIFLNPVLKDAHLANHYRTNGTYQTQDHLEDNQFYQAIYSHGLDLLLKHRPEGKLLDVGCSSGTFLKLAASKGFEVMGLEINSEEAAEARSRGLRVQELDLLSLEDSGKFHVICFWDVFEHLKFPHQILGAASSLLSEDGLMLLQIPSADSLSARVLREHCNMFDGLEHVALYTHQSISQCLEKNDFEILEVVDVIDDTAALENFLNYEDPYSGSFTGSLSDVFSADFILGNNFGYKMQIVARKR